MRRAALALAVSASACTTAPATAPPPAFAPDPGGIALVGSPLRIDFGRAEEGVIAAVTRLEGAGPRDAAACSGGTRALRWPSGLALHFRDGAFLGWSRQDGSGAGLTCA